VRIAYSTLACPGRRLEETLELGVQAGYEGVELRLIDGELIDPGMSAQDRARVADACAKAGLPIAAVDSSIRVAAPADPHDVLAQISAFLDLAAEWGAPTVRVFGGELPDSVTARQERLASAADVLQLSNSGFGLASRPTMRSWRRRRSPSCSPWSRLNGWGRSGTAITRAGLARPPPRSTRPSVHACASHR